MALQDDISRLEANIEKLRTQYDQFFLGFEKRPPDKLRLEVERSARGMVGIKTPNTGLRFRANQAVQKLATYRQLWDRVLTQIEEGTYKRDIFRAKLHEKWKAERKSGGTEEVIEDAEFFEDDAAPAAKYGGVFDDYLKARKETNEGSTGITYDKLHDVLEKQAAQIRSKYGAKEVDFRVVIENGKARLKATPKK